MMRFRSISSGGQISCREVTSAYNRYCYPALQRTLFGGIRATIPQKNILIDHSFAGNFEAAYKDFKFDGGPEHE